MNPRGEQVSVAWVIALPAVPRGCDFNLQPYPAGTTVAVAIAHVELVNHRWNCGDGHEFGGAEACKRRETHSLGADSGSEDSLHVGHWGHGSRDGFPVASPVRI